MSDRKKFLEAAYEKLVIERDFTVRLCWECMPEHVHLKTVERIVCCPGCGKNWYKGEDVRALAEEDRQNELREDSN